MGMVCVIWMLYAIKKNQMSKKNNWILVSLGIASIAFIISWLLLGYWKVSLIVAVICGLIALSLNPVRRYMKAFWAVFSLLISLNSLSLKFASHFLTKNSINDIEASMGTISSILNISLIVLCVVLLSLDFFERNGSPIFSNTKMIQKGGKNSKNYQSKGDINITNHDER